MVGEPLASNCSDGDHSSLPLAVYLTVPAVNAWVNRSASIACRFDRDHVLERW